MSRILSCKALVNTSDDSFYKSQTAQKSSAELLASKGINKQVADNLLKLLNNPTNLQLLGKTLTEHKRTRLIAEQLFDEDDDNNDDMLPYIDDTEDNNIHQETKEDLSSTVRSPIMAFSNNENVQEMHRRKLGVFTSLTQTQLIHLAGKVNVKVPQSEAASIVNFIFSLLDLPGAS